MPKWHTSQNTSANLASHTAATRSSFRCVCLGAKGTTRSKTLEGEIMAMLKDITK